MAAALAFVTLGEPRCFFFLCVFLRQKRTDLKRQNKLCFSIMKFVSFVLVWIIMSVFCATATPPRVTLCYLYFGTISDLGWSFTYNQGRLKIHDILTAEFPNTTIESVSVQNVFAVSNKRHLISGVIDGSRCNVVLTNNDQLLGGKSENDYFASKYPSVFFVLLGEPWLAERTFANVLYVANDYTGGFYAAGAAAAAQSQRCIAFVSAWDNEVDPTSSFAGFLLGVRSVNATIPLHVISAAAWYNPEHDRVLADLFVLSTTNGLQCDVIARYSDPYTTDVAVYSSGRRGAFSIGCHSNLAQYIGDTVLTSVYVDWSVVLLPPIRSVLANNSLDRSRIYFPGLVEGAITVARPSPSGSRAAAAALVSAIDFVKQSAGDIICGPIALRRGGLLQYPTGRTCKVTHANIGDFITDAHVVHHPTFAGPEACGAGHTPRYEWTPALTLVCTPCPRNTFSSLPGMHECLPCASGLGSEQGSAACASTSLGVASVVGVAVGCGGGTTVALVLVGLWWRHVRTRNALAPRHAPVCLLHTDVEGCTVMWRLNRKDMRKDMAQYRTIVRRVMAANSAYEVRTTGESFLIATQDITDAMIVAVEIQRELHEATWTLTFPGDEGSGLWNGPRVSIGLHVCRDESALRVSFDPVLQRFAYDGSEVRVAARIGHLAQGGQILLTRDTWDVLTKEEHFDLLLSGDVQQAVWGSECKLLPECPDLVTLLSVTPKELSRRQFAQCPIGIALSASAFINNNADTSNMHVDHLTAAKGGLHAVVAQHSTQSSSGGHVLGNHIMSCSESEAFGPPSDVTHVADAAMATSVLQRLLTWLGVSQRKQLLTSIAQALERDQLLRPYRSTGSPHHSSADDTGSLRSIATTHTNPRRLTAAAAVVLSRMNCTRLVAVQPLDSFEARQDPAQSQADSAGEEEESFEEDEEGEMAANPLAMLM